MRKPPRVRSDAPQQTNRIRSSPAWPVMEVVRIGRWTPKETRGGTDCTAPSEFMELFLTPPVVDFAQSRVGSDADPFDREKS